MTVKHIFQTGEDFRLICENCLIGTNKCAHCQKSSLGGSVIQSSSTQSNTLDDDYRLQKCLVKTCDYFFHKKCIPEVRK
jgi:hypothetical protein